MKIANTGRVNKVRLDSLKPGDVFLKDGCEVCMLISTKHYPILEGIKFVHLDTGALNGYFPNYGADTLVEVLNGEYTY